MDVKIHVKIQLLVKSVEQHALLDVSAMKATSVTQMENVFLPKNALQFYHKVSMNQLIICNDFFIQFFANN